MRNTQRTLLNFPASLDNLINLRELDISQNNLPKIPDVIYNLINLKRLNVSDNEIKEITANIENLQKLESLNLSRNEINVLPTTICKLAKLRQLYVNDNELNFDGVPAGIGKLPLETFSVANNKLEMIPESLCRCGSLKKLNLSFNQLITLPDAIYLLSDLDVLDLRDNPELIMPAKPMEMQRGDGVEFYNIDFSLQNQLRLAGAAPASSTAQTSATNKDPIARKLRLRRARNDSGEDSAKILKGMKDIAKDKYNQENGESPEKTESLRPKKWDETLEKPPVDYSEIFDEDDGTIPGLTVWEIENFLPNKINEVAHGKFYEGDCYIILKTSMIDTQLDWEIYFWIGNNATLDKKACSAIHAVNLRNFLGARCRTIREEQGDESDEFLALFDKDIVYIEGGRTSTGFYTIEDSGYVTRLYCVLTDENVIFLEPCDLSYEALNPANVYILDFGLKLFLWHGKRSRNTLKSKARLMAEKINKNDRKNKAEIITEPEDGESEDFLQVLGIQDKKDKPKTKPALFDYTQWKPVKPRLYQVQLGMGYLEMPQVDVPGGKLVHTLLNSKNVYILDCNSDLFVWFGKKSTRLVRAAAIKLSQELFNMITRPDFALITRVQEGTESQVFKCKFTGWDEVIPVDFTRTAQSVARTGADLARWAKKQETKADLAALFMPRQLPMTVLEAQQLAEDWNYDLDAMEAFVLEGKKFIRLPEEELGVFYTNECYVFLCRYCIPVDDDVAEDGQENPGDGKQGPIPDDEIQCVVYFWQGRDAGNMGWLTFTFTLQKKFKAMFGEELEVVRIHQQQENLKFMSHFKGKFVIKLGKRTDRLPEKHKKPPVEFYYLRSNGSTLCTRLIQIRPDASLLNSAFW